MAAPLISQDGLFDRDRIVELLELMRSRGVQAFRLRRGDEEIEVRWPDPGPADPTAVAPAPTGQRSAPRTAGEPIPSGPTPTTLHAIVSPVVGTYFSASEPGRPPFVRVGDRVIAGQVLCTVESMLLMTEIAADTAGVVEDLPIANGGSVKAGQVVCLLRLDEQL